MRRTAPLLLTWLLAATASAGAIDVELRLVAHDQPETTVDKLERSRPIIELVPTERGMESQQVGLDLVCWARGVRLDGQPVFERYHQGKYIGRLPLAQAKLNPGPHTIWPGDHIFEITKDGTVTTQDPELAVEGHVVRIKCYPVTLRAYRANPDEARLPMSMRITPLPDLTIRESADHERAMAAEKGKETKVVDLLPVFDKFAPLTLWLPANAVGKGYLVHPLGLTFHLGAGGLAAGPGLEGLHVQGSVVEVPLFGYPVEGPVGGKLVVPGVEQFLWGSHDEGRRFLTNWYPRREPYEVRVSEDGPAIAVEGSLSDLPIKRLKVDIPDRAKGTQRLLAVELATRHLTPGTPLALRIRAAEAAGPVGDAASFAQLQAERGSEWLDLKLTGAADGKAEVAVPDVPDGAYRLRLGVRPADGSRKPIATEQWVSVAGKRAIGVGLFTERGRTAFFRGESFWIALAVLAPGAPVPAGTPLTVDLVDPSGRRLAFYHGATPPTGRQSGAIRGRETFVFRADAALSLNLAPGRYRAEARVGDRASQPLPLDIVEPEPRTHFTNLLNGKYNALGSLYQQTLRSGEGADELAREIASLGCNAFMGMSYDLSRVRRRDLDLEQLVRERPELGPWESHYQPSGRDRFLNAAVRNGLRFYEDIFTHHDTTLPREPRILDACERLVSLEVASMRHSPAFRGVCLYDEFYNSSDSDTSQATIAAFQKAQEMAYRDANPGMTSALAMKALDRFVGRPAGQRRPEDLAKFRTWPAHEDDEWRAFSERMAAAAKAVMPEARNFTLMRFWGGNGGNIASNGTPSGVFSGLDAAACVMYKDGGYGDRPVFAPMQADVMRVREGLPAWTQLHSFGASGLFGQHLVRQAFAALSQKIEGFTYFTIPADYTHPSQLDSRDTIRDIAERLCTPYGDLFVACSRGYRKVAIYYSREADYLTLRKPNKLGYACEGLWVACLRAGFPADFLYDHQVRAGAAGDYDVLFVPGITYEDECPPDILAELRRLAQAGKIIATERSSKLPVEGVYRLDSDLDEYDDKMGGAFPRNIDFESEMVWDQTEEMTRVVRAFLSKHVAPAAMHDLLVGPDWLRCGAAEYLVVPNFKFTRFTGLYKTLYQAPDRPTLRFPKRPPACYDMLEMKRADVATEGDWMSLQTDFRHYPGRIYAFLPAAVGGLDLRATASARAGTSVNYQVAVLDAAGKPIDAGFPLQVTLLDPGGRSFFEVYRAAAPTFRGVYRLPANVPAGKWTLRVRELIAGTQAEAAVDVSEGTPRTAVLDTRPVRVSDGDRVRQFLAGKAPIVIAVDDDQPWVRPHAERLAKALAERGRDARIVAPAEAVRLPGDWSREAPNIDGTRLWRGSVVMPGLFVDAPLILLGKRFENRLIEALIRRDALAEPVSANFPGPGKALLAWTRQAFSNQHDTVTVLANDDEGLSRGIDALLSLDKLPPAEPVHPSIERPKPDPDAPLAAATKHASAPTSLGDALSGEDLVRCVDADPASGRVLVGTHGYGQNLFCFAANGNLLWKQFLPEHHVYFAQWIDGGKRAVAATGRGFFVFLLSGEDGRVLKKFSSTEWPRFHGGFATYQEGAVDTQVPIVVIPRGRNAPPTGQILIGGLTGLMAIDFDGKKMWYRDRAEAIASYPAEAVQWAGAEFGRTAVVGDFAPSPDGKRIVHGEYRIVGSTQIDPDHIAPVWQFTPMILDATTGKVLAENTEDPGNVISPSGWEVLWPAGSEVPWVRFGGLAAPLQADGKRGDFVSLEGRWLDDGGRLVATTTRAERFAPSGRSLWETSGETIWLPELDRLSADQSRLYRCDRDGLVRCMSMSGSSEPADGRPLWEHKLPFSAVACPAGDGLVAGTKNGVVVRLDASGKEVWHARLRDLFERPGKDYPAYVQAALQRDPDSTEEFFPTGRDQPGDYKGVLRMGLEQLVNGGFESVDGWSAARVEGPAHSGKAALSLAAGQPVTQPLKRRIVPSATYLLEFFYRVESTEARLVAGALLAGAKESFTGSKFAARPGEWAFGRLAVKTMADTRALTVGFEADGGAVRVDDASFRPVRFPSANLVANGELHAIEPTFVHDIRVRYDRIPGSLRDKLMSQNHVVALKQGLSSTAAAFSEEQAFLHNGRLDDVGPVWFYQPDSAAFSVVLTRPAWISDLVLYLNNATPGNVYQTISIVANNLETKLPQAVALVRGNRRRFVVVHFPELLQTDTLKIIPGMHRAHRECLTEVEVYGPLGGKEMAEQGKRFAADPQGFPMFMGGPAHVPKALPADLAGEYAELGRHRMGAPAYLVGGTLVDGVFTFGEAAGAIRSIQVGEPDPKQGRGQPVSGSPEPADGPRWQVGTVTPTTTPARYAGRLLVGSADGCLHAVADNGTHLWAFQTGGRVYAAPVPDGDEVYFGSDDGKLYKVDVDSGTLIWEFATGDKIRSAPALADGKVFAASWDGFLYAVDADTGLEAWKAPIAKYTRSSPAVQGGKVLIGDEQGRLCCFEASTGKPLWQREVGGRISGCPVVTPEGVFAASDQGDAAFFAAAPGGALDGTLRWKRGLGTRLAGQPVATQSQLLLPTEKGLLVLRRADGQPDPRFVPPESPGKVISALPCGDKLFMLVAEAKTDFRSPPRTYAEYNGFPVVWAPKANKAGGTK